MSCQTQISEERFAIIQERYANFIGAVKDTNQEPITVFDPLNSKQLEELELIRGVSKDLQAQKEEDMRKAAKAKEEEKIEAEKEKQKETETTEVLEEPKKEE